MTTTAPESVIDMIGEILIGTFEIPAEEVKADARMGDLIADSLMVVEMAIALQDALGVKVDERELGDATLAQVAAAIEARRSAPQP
ncbi:acyl carrier protein [Streptomyces avidinii]